jgi:hypothetical protein
MDENKSIKLTHKEVTVALIKHQKLHEGIWQLYVEFGIAAGNMPIAEENQDNLRVCPTAFVPIKTIGLLMVDKENPLAVDASKVNPPTPESNT